MSRKEEKYTTITWTSADQKATVDSMHPDIFRQCERAGAVETEPEVGIRKGNKVRRVFLVDKTYVKIRGPRKLNLSEEARAKRRENLRPLRRHPTSPDFLSTESREKAADTHEAEPHRGEQPVDQQNHRLSRHSRMER